MATIEDFEKLDMINPFTSEVLTLGVSDKEGKCVLVVPDKKTAQPGDKLF